MMWTILVGLALAAPPADLAVDLAARLPQARAQLDACARTGCARADGARAAWLVALATYLDTGVADGQLSATVRALDPGLWAELPEVLLAAAGEPSAWVDHVGGPAPLPAPSARLPRDAAERVEAIRATQADRRPRFFVVTDPDSERPYDDPRLTRELARWSAEPAARFYPAGDLCQQGLPQTEPAASPDVAAPLGAIDFARQGAFTPTRFAEEYGVWVDGTEVLVEDFGGELAVPVGRHQVAMVRSDGVGPVIEVEVTVSGPAPRVRDLADACVADALRGGSEGLAPHLRSLSERVPGADLYVAEVGDKLRSARLWRWDGASLQELPAR